MERLGNEPFVLLGVNSDTDPDAYRAQREEWGVTWPSTFEGSTTGPWPRAWGVRGWPTVYVIDANGVIRDVFVGVDEETLDASIERVLAEARQSPWDESLFRGDPSLAVPEGPQSEAADGPTIDAAVPALGSPGATEASIRGRVVFAGEVPKERETAEPDVRPGCCPDEKEKDLSDRSLLIAEDGGVANVVVKLEGTGLKAIARKAPYPLTIEGCRFEPHVLAIPRGSRVKFKNADSGPHMVHTLPRRNPAFNRTYAPGAHTIEGFGHAEVVQVVDDLHPWMSAYVYVTDSPLVAVTGPDGSFELERVPVGEFELEWWHEDRLVGKGKVAVEVKAGEVTEVVIRVGDED